MTTRYTFLLPAFKGRYLDEMLRSIKAQTYTDFKVIISDDCSPEDLRSICEPYLSDPRFTYRRNEENMGSKSLVSHWNLLVDMCDTDYLIMASDDDVYEPQFLEEIDALVQKYPNVDLFRGRVRLIDGEGELLEEDILMHEYQKQLDFLYYFFHYDILKCLANFVFRTSALKDKGKFYDMPLAWCVDNMTVVKLSDGGVCHTPSINFSFRCSGMNISTSGGKEIVQEKSREVYECIKFFDAYIGEIKKEIHSKKDNEQYKRIVKSINSGFYERSLLEGSELSSYKEMMKYYHCLSRMGRFGGKLDKIHFFWSWIRAFKVRNSK